MKANIIAYKPFRYCNNRGNSILKVPETIRILCNWKLKWQSIQFHWTTESQDVWGWKGPLEIILSYFPAQAGTCRTSSPGPRPQGFWISPKMEAPQPLGNLCLCSATLTAPDVQSEHPGFQVVPVVFCPVSRHHWKESGSVTFAPSLQVFIHW